MNSHPKFDRESFQALLANAFSVQKSGMDPQALCAFVEIQRAIAAPGADVDRSLHLIAERARAVAHASGIGIALLQANQLIHRAGSGSASENVGRQLAAVFSAPERNDPYPEILRVEDAQADSRIEAEICRQFDARALLMMPIYRERVVIGVLEVFFREPHIFQPCEVRTYQLMATLVADATTVRIHAPAPTLQAPVNTVSNALWRMQSQVQPLPTAEETVPEPAFEMLESAPWFAPVVSFAAALWDELAVRLHSLQLTPTVTRSLALIYRRKLSWNIAAIPLFIALAIAAAIANHHASTPALSNSATGAPDAVQSEPPSLPSRQVDSGPLQATERQPSIKPSPAFRRVWVGQNEMDEISDDVTIRHFHSRPAKHQSRTVSKQVDFGADVTVRYFNSQDARLRPQPVSVPEQTNRDPLTASQ